MSLTYEQDRTIRINRGPQGATINNTGNSRQVRRARERQFDKCDLSNSLMGKLETKYVGQGIFMQHMGAYRIYGIGWPNETRKPRRDHSQRYASLFKLSAHAPDVQGRDGSGIPEAPNTY